MQTTQLFVEFVLIGLESSISLGLILSCIIGIDKMKSLISLFESATMTIVLIGLLYVLGIILDSISYFVLFPWNKRVKNKTDDKKSNALILKDYQSYLDFTMSQIRILRSTAVNSVFLMCGGIAFIITQLNDNKTGLIIFVLVFCMSAFFGSLFMWKMKIKKFHKNSKIIEQEQKDM